MNYDKTKYIVNFLDVTEEVVTIMKTRSLEKLEEFKYLGNLLTNQNSIQDEIKCRLKSGNASFHSVKNQLSSSVLHQNIKIQIYRTIILFVYFVWVLNLLVHPEAELRLRVFENRELRRTFGLRGTM